ncbi:MAG: OmpA family protein [Nitrospinae bacterium]|nr:OmpA family protein [Nitrospinota bacterium]
MNRYLRGCWVLVGVNFALDSAELTHGSGAILDRAAAVLVRNPGLRIKVDGHTDSSGDDKYNMGLSQRRAESVRSYLIRKGASARNLSAQGFGESKPIATNATKEGRALNRRVELSVL